MPGEHLTGGCLCGAIRYGIDRVFDVMYCHCSRCRKATGAAALACAYVEGDAFHLTQGRPGVYISSPEGNRCFCRDCGSPLYFEGQGGRYYSVHLGTLDDPERQPPQIHQCVETKLSWLALSDDLPRVTGNILPHPDERRRPPKAFREEEMSQENKRLVRRLADEVWNAEALDKIEELYAEDYVADYRPYAPLQNGHEGIRDMIRRAHLTLPDYHEELEEVIAEGDKVVVRLTITGTQLGSWGQLPPTGKKVRFEEIVILRIRDGKVVWQRGIADNLSALRQLGAIPRPSAADPS